MKSLGKKRNIHHLVQCFSMIVSNLGCSHPLPLSPSLRSATGQPGWCLFIYLFKMRTGKNKSVKCNFTASFPGQGCGYVTKHAKYFAFSRIHLPPKPFVPQAKKRRDTESLQPGEPFMLFFVATFSILEIITLTPLNYFFTTLNKSVSFDLSSLFVPGQLLCKGANHCIH